MKKDRRFLVKDIDCEVIVEVMSRKEALEWMDEYIENLENLKNLPYEWFDGSNDCFHILYKDGTCDCINEDYDGHKIRRINIESIVYDNAETSMVYGNFEINEYGVVTTAFEEKIAQDNIVEIK